jgi:hypothetical protein
MKAIFDRAKTIVEEGTAYICLNIPYRDARKFVGEMKDKKYEVTIKEFREKRSLDANAYCWVLLDKLAEVLREPKEQIYRSYIREIGGNCEVVCVLNSAVDRLRKGWERNGLGWLTETEKSKIDGCTNVVLYYGSSTYDTKQMSRLIDLIIQDCKGCGIETLPPERLAGMIEEWGK